MKYLNTDEMMALESHACDSYPITLDEMMQNAGKAVFDVVMEQIPDQVGNDKKKVLVVAGKGNNGGDALVTARLLHEKGIDVTILSPYADEEFSGMAKEELEKVQNFNIPIIKNLEDLSGFGLIIDALFGFSLRGNPRPQADKIIEQILCSQIPVLAVDVPSGLDVHDGSVGQPTIKADYTVAFGKLKKGFEEHPDLVGKVYLGDLGIPEQAYEDLGYKAPLFRGKSNFLVSQKLGKGNRRAGQSLR